MLRRRIFDVFTKFFNKFFFSTEDKSRRAFQKIFSSASECGFSTFLVVKKSAAVRRNGVAAFFCCPRCAGLKQ